MFVQRKIKLEDNSRLQIRALTTKEPLLWLASQPDEKDHYRQSVYLINQTDHKLDSVYFYSNSIITVDEQAYGSGNNGRYYMDVECGEAIQVEQVDLIYDSDLIIELHLKISATKLGEETFRHTIKKGKIKDKVLLWKD